MTTSQENKLSAYRTLKGVCASTESIWGDVKAMSDDFTEFTQNLDRIETLAKTQGEPATGLTEDKQLARENMAKAGFVIASPVAAYAAKTNNRDLLAKVDFSLNDLLTGRDTTSRDRCQGICDAVAPIIKQLGDYDLAAADLKDLQDKIDTFSELLTKPREKRATKKTATSQLAEAFDATDTLLTERLDKLVNRFQIKNPAFVSDYQNARLIVDTSATRTVKPAPTPAPTPTK